MNQLRFREPIPEEPWEEIYDSVKYGPMAPQAWEEIPPIKILESKDGLFLNILTPQADNNKRIIMNYWTNFPYNGSPNGSDLSNWPTFLTEKQRIMQLDVALNVADRSKTNTILRVERCLEKGFS